MDVVLGLPPKKHNNNGVFPFCFLLTTQRNRLPAKKHRLKLSNSFLLKLDFSPGAFSFLGGSRHM